MILRILASGSSGNCSCIQYKNQILFVDIGITTAKIKKLLDKELINNNIKLFITHEHTDHISGLIPFTKKYRPEIYTSEKVAELIVKKGINDDLIYILDKDIYYDFGNFAVTPFALMHDALQPLGYKFDMGDKVISFATDFGIVSDYIYKSIEGSDTILLEANYEDELLKKSSYAESLKKRIASQYGHLSNKEAGNLVCSLSKAGLKRCFFTHISENNNDYNIVENYATYCRDNYNVITTVIKQRTVVETSLYDNK